MTEQVFTKRCTPAERKAFTPRGYWERFQSDMQIGEPALGTLEQRLDIIIRRLGGRNRIVLTNAERAELEQYRVSE